MLSNNNYLYAVLCLLLGILIYVLFRNDVIILDFLGLNKYEVIVLPDSCLTRFVLYHLSDTLWVLSIMFYASSQRSKLLRILAIIIPLVMEMTQIFSVVPGCFDMQDLLIYILVILFFYIKWKKRNEI